MRLFLLQPTAGRANACIEQWQTLQQPTDITVIMGDSAQAFCLTNHNKYGKLYCLELEYALLAPDVKKSVQILNYDNLVDIINCADHVMSLR